MELTLGLFPLIRTVLLILFITAVVYAFYKGKTSVGKWLLVAGAITMFGLTFLKYDGTNSTSTHKLTEQATSDRYDSELEEAGEVVTTPKLTFTQRMAAEEARSAKANKAITDDIKGQ